MSTHPLSLDGRQMSLFSALSTGKDLPADIPEPILRLQRQRIQTRMVEQLAQSFQSTAALLGHALFGYTAKFFFSQAASGFGGVIEGKEEFPYFLSQCKAVSKHPYISDMAFLDLAYKRSDCTPNNIPCKPNQLNPSVFWFSSAHPIVSLWHTRKPCSYAKRLKMPAENALIFRKNYYVHVINIAPSYAYFLDSLGRGETLTLATRYAHQIDPQFDAKMTLEWMSAQGILTSKAGSNA